MKVDFIIRILEAIINAFNIKKKKDAANNPASTIANGGRVRNSSKSYTDLADEPGSDRDE